MGLGGNNLQPAFKNDLSRYDPFPALSDNQGMVLVVSQTYFLIALTVVFGGLVLWGWWYQHRRAWPTSKKDESMRRHVSKIYD
jgi:hypothetical protein